MIPNSASNTMSGILITFGDIITGGCETYNGPYITVTASYSNYGPPPDVKAEIEDERRNPHAWARWFREFLNELLGAGRAVLKEARQRHPLLKRIEQSCRSAPLHTREWKIKLWKQKFAGVV